MVATGDGSATMQVLSNPTHIFVSALVADPGGSTSTGVTIRRADSDDRISLVRVWGTTDGYELRQGTSVLESFTATGLTHIKLKIVDAQSGTTDIECYVNDVLVHTETGVSFTLPDVLHLGMICEDGGKWTGIRMSPCPPPACDTEQDCSSLLTLPSAWTLDAGELTEDVDCLVDDCKCDQLSGSWTLAVSSIVFGWDQSPPNQGAFISGVSTCEFNSIDFGKGVTDWYMNPDGTGPVDPDTPGAVFVGRGWGAFSLNAFGLTPEGGPVRHDRYDHGCQQTLTAWGAEFVLNDADEPDPGDLAETKYRVLVNGRVLNFVGALYDAQGRYGSDWNDIGTGPLDLTSTPITVNLLPDGTSSSCDDVTHGCVFPASLTLNPASVELQRFIVGRVNGTGSRCGLCEPVLDDPDDIVFLGILPDGDIRVCMLPTFDEESGNWKWTGTTTNTYGTCVGSVLITGTLACIEPEEGSGRQWTLTLTTPQGTFSYPLENISEADGTLGTADVSGPISLCTGETSLPMVGTIEPCEEPVFEACCDDEIGCCGIQIQATGEIVDPNDPCTITNCVGRGETLDLQTGAIVCTTTTTPISPTGWDHTKQYYRGSVPISAANPDIFSGHSLLVYCGGGAVRWATIDADGCVTDSGEIADWDCETRTGTIDLTAYSTADCCDGFGAGFYRITLNG